MPFVPRELYDELLRLQRDLRLGKIVVNAEYEEEKPATTFPNGDGSSWSWTKATTTTSETPSPTPAAEFSARTLTLDKRHADDLPESVVVSCNEFASSPKARAANFRIAREMQRMGQDEHAMLVAIQQGRGA